MVKQWAFLRRVFTRARIRFSRAASILRSYVMMQEGQPRIARDAWGPIAYTMYFMVDVSRKVQALFKRENVLRTYQQQPSPHLLKQVAKLRDVIVAVREVRAAGRAPSSEKNAANTSPVGTPSSREEAGVSLQKEESLPPDASSKPKKNRNTPLVWAGKPSQEFIAASSTRHLEREPYWWDGAEQ